MTALWSMKALGEAMKAVAQGDLSESVTGISIDSRTITPGDAYFAILGDVHDGHAFAGAALDKGAACAVVSEDFAKTAPPGRYLVVPDVLEALRMAGDAARARMNGKVIAVTGSVGKTSTKEALASVLSAQGKTHAALASFNNHWGVPLTLARMPEDTEFGVFEIGMNHSGEIIPLVALVRPHVAIITTVEPVHIAHFPSEEAIADAKAEIFTGLEPGGVAILNRDNRFFDRLVAKAQECKVSRIVSFGASEGSDILLQRLVLKADCSLIEADVLGEELTCKLGSPGQHLAMNALAVLGAVKLAGGDLALAALALAGRPPVKGRGERVPLLLRGGEALLIDESYNANPVSLRAALAVLDQAEIGEKGRRIAVLGDMLELGPEAEGLHASLVPAIVSGRTDLVFCCGPLMQNLWKGLPADRRGAYADNSADLESAVLSALRPGDVLMVKGSNGSRMGRIVEALKTHAKPADDL